MLARVRAVPFDEYQAWYDRQAADIVRRAKAAATAAQADPGRRNASRRAGGIRVGKTALPPRHGHHLRAPHDRDDRGPREGAAADHRARGAARAEGLDVVDHDDRSQEDRDHVPVHDPRLLLPRRGRGAAAAHPAGVAGEHVPLPREVQPALHDARHDDDLPGHRAGLGRIRELRGAADDRRARRRLPAHQRLVVLDVPVRRDRALRVDVLHPARGRVVLLCAALAEGVLAQRRSGRVDLHGPPHRVSRRCSAR